MLRREKIGKMQDAREVTPKAQKYRAAWPVEPPHAMERDGNSMSLLTICLPYPPSLNTYWRHLKNGRTIISLAGRLYRAHVEMVANRYMLSKAFPTQRLAVSIDLVMPDRRTRDIDNLAKVIFDAFTASRMWGDDSQVDEMHIYRKGISAPGFVIVTVAAI